MNRAATLRVVGPASLFPFLPRPVDAAGETVRIIGLPIDTGLEVQYAESAGMVKQAGLDLQTQLLTAGAAVQSAIAGGAADIGLSNVGSLSMQRSSPSLWQRRQRNRLASWPTLMTRSRRAF